MLPALKHYLDPYVYILKSVKEEAAFEVISDKILEDMSDLLDIGFSKKGIRTGIDYLYQNTKRREIIDFIKGYDAAHYADNRNRYDWLSDFQHSQN